jgi:predicted HicB family RNase H-like nuclease
MVLKWIGCRVDENLYARIRAAAAADRRSVANWLVLSIEKVLAESERASA